MLRRVKNVLRLDECGLKAMSSELKESQITSKMENRPGVSEGVVVPVG